MFMLVSITPFLWIKACRKMARYSTIQKLDRSFSSASFAASLKLPPLQDGVANYKIWRTLAGRAVSRFIPPTGSNGKFRSMVKRVGAHVCCALSTTSRLALSFCISDLSTTSRLALSLCIFELWRAGLQNSVCRRTCTSRRAIKFLGSSPSGATTPFALCQQMPLPQPSLPW